jgi:AcrR family transcriptional regulator
MDDIVKESGLSKGALYWYFKSKDDLIIAIFDRMFSRELSRLQALRDAPASASERLIEFTERVIDDVTIMLRFMPLAYEFLALAFRNKVVQKAFKAYINRYMDILIPIIQQGIDSGEFKAKDAREVAIASGAIFEGTILLWVYDKDLIEPEKHICAGIHLLLDGIKA